MHLNNAGDPVWRDGDVVRIRFYRKRTDDLGEEYTYVREDGHWPGEAFWSTHTDEVMTAAWHENRATVLQMTAATADPEVAPLKNLLEEGRAGFWAVYDCTHRNPDVTVFHAEADAYRWAFDPIRRFNDMLRVRFFDFSDDD